MTEQDKLAKDFEESLENNRRQIEERRESIRRATGRSMPKNRAKWLRDLALKRARERLAS